MVIVVWKPRRDSAHESREKIAHTPSAHSWSSQAWVRKITWSDSLIGSSSLPSNDKHERRTVEIKWLHSSVSEPPVNNISCETNKQDMTTQTKLEMAGLSRAIIRDENGQEQRRQLFSCLHLISHVTRRCICPLKSHPNTAALCRRLQIPNYPQV